MNETIQHSRDVALSLLQPSERDLEHGLELHRSSLVFDAYGFAPRAAIDGAALGAAVDAGASDGMLQDMAEEMSMTRWALDAVEREEFREAFDAAGVTCIFQNAGEESQAPLRLLKRLARFTFATDRAREVCFHAAFPDDVLRAKAEGRHCLYFTGNGVPLAQQWDSLEDELGFVRLFFQLGIRMMHLTYNRRNLLGDGCAEPANAGLSDAGRAAIAEMNRLGVIVDVAHSAWQTSLEAAKASTRPMVASHSVCAALNPHCRSKPDEVIRAIADTGGYLGICWVPAFLAGTGDIRALLDHIVYAARAFGAEHVAIGTDCAYTSRQYAEEWQKVPGRRAVRPRWESFWPPNDALFSAEWQREEQRESLAWTNWPLVTVGLVQRGLKDDDIRKILGENVLRVARQALEA